MTIDFDMKAVICALLFRYQKNRRRKLWMQESFSLAHHLIFMDPCIVLCFS